MTNQIPASEMKCRVGSLLCHIYTYLSNCACNVFDKMPLRISSSIYALFHVLNIIFFYINEFLHMCQHQHYQDSSTHKVFLINFLLSEGVGVSVFH